MSTNRRILYLDQNKWVDIARAVTYPDQNPQHRAVLELLVREATAGRIIVPLTQTNIYETHKINVEERRFILADTQARLSQGKVFCGRHRRLEVEVIDVMRAAYGLERLPRADDWFLSDVFFEAALDWHDPRFDETVSPRFAEAVKANPPHFLFNHLMETPDEVRRKAVQKFTEGAEKLKALIEERRRRDAGESLSMRRRIYSATLVANELDVILGFLKKAGLPTKDEREVMEKCAQKLITDAPSYDVEVEITLKIEAQPRPVTENDFRDMQTFCTVIPYADIVIGENNFINMARQAGLGKKYETDLLTDLAGLPEILGG
jgi:hypothetical protein